MGIKVKDLGDGRTIVLYTDDIEVYQKLRRSAKCWKIVPYWQKEQHRLDEKFVGVDLYFDKGEENWLIQVLSPKKVTFS